MGQLPVNYNYTKTKNYVDIDCLPLYPFGYGLSYSEFSFADFDVKPASLEEIKNGGCIEVSITVKNTSSVAGKAVPQLYIHRRGGTVSHRNKELKGFEKVSLSGGEEKKVTFSIGYDDLKEWSMNNKYEIFSQKIEIMIGDSSRNIVFEDTVKI